MLNLENLTGPSITLTPLTKDKVEQVSLWRTSEQVKKFFIFRGEISPTQQLQWFEKISLTDDNAYFIIQKKNQDIGLCEIKGISEGEGEWGIFIFPEDEKDGFTGVESAILLLNYGFSTLNLNKITAQVLRFNAVAHRLNTKLGFKQVGLRVIESLQEEVLELEVTREDFLEKNQKFLKFFMV